MSGQSSLDLGLSFMSAGAEAWATQHGLMFEGDSYTWAVFDATRTYRYMLGRAWNLAAPVATWAMNNPSKAGAFQSDPSVQKVIGFTKRVVPDAGGFIVVNKGAFIATSPSDFDIADDPVGRHNDDALRFALVQAKPIVVIAAWGAITGQRSKTATQASVDLVLKHNPRCLGVSAGGHPRHPLMLSYATSLVALPLP